MFRRLLAISALLLCFAAFASADSFNFIFAGYQGSTASGTLVTTPEGSGQFLITSITNGLIDGVSASLLPPGSLYNNDNLLFVPDNPGYLDFSGFAFADVNGNEFNLDYNDFFFGYSLGGTNGLGDFGTFTLSQVPEPSSILLFATGLLGAVGALRRKLMA